MKNVKKLSIIVPIYNVEKYLEKCVKSICAYAPENSEIILVDDGATDKSGKIAEELAKQNENIIVLHKENGGLSDARNYGIKNSSGEYIIFIDSDDYVDENFSKIGKFLDGENEVVWVGYITEFLRKTVIYKHDKNQKIDSEKLITSFIVPNSTKINSACLKAIRRDFLEKYNLYFEKGFAEDFNWTARFLCHVTKMQKTDICYYHYVAERAGSIMNTYKKQRFYDLIAHAKSAYKELDSCEISKGRRRKIEEYIGFNLIRNFARMNKLPKEEQKEILKLLHDNESMFKKQGTFLTKGFYLFAKIFGFRFAYKFVK